MTALNRILLLGNRALAISVVDMLRTEAGVEIFCVANPDDDGTDTSGGLSLKRRLEAWGIPYLQPAGLKDEAVLRRLAEFQPDLALSCSYARIIPRAVIDLPRYGCLNVHFAALPKNRGCLPVIWTIANGEADYSATLHVVTEGLDEGAIVAAAHRPLGEGMTAGEAYAACADLGRDLVAGFWRASRETGRYAAVPQDERAMTYHTFRFPYDRWIPWQLPARDVASMINALTYLPHPSARTRLHGDDSEMALLGPARVCAGGAAESGEVVELAGEIRIGCGEGLVSIAAVRNGNVAVPLQSTLRSGMRLASPVMELYTA